MAAPRYCLSAHQHDTLAYGLRNELTQVVRKFGRLHVIGKTAERQVPPSSIQGSRMRVAETSQAGDVLITNAIGSELVRQGLAVELRVVAGAWYGSHVHESGHRVRL